jgi:hypothetical protein
MQVETLALPAGEARLPPGAGSPIVSGAPQSVLPPIEPSVFNLLALVGGIGALIATELGVAGSFALF